MRERLQHAESGHHKALMRGRLLEEQQRELMEEQRKRRVDSAPHTQVCRCTHIVVEHASDIHLIIFA